MPHPIVADERALFDQVSGLLQTPMAQVTPSEKPMIDELLRIREELGTAKGDDHGALIEQYHAQVSLLEQIRSARGQAQVNPASPYFAHLRLREEIDGEMRERDLCLGKATRIERGMRIVDWRDAPVSRLFYQYRQGDTYEEELGGRMVEGEVVTRRTVAIRAAELQAIYAPEGVFQRGQDGDWRQTTVDKPRLAGGSGNALHWHKKAGNSGPQAHDRRLGQDHGGRQNRRDKHLPDIAGLIDPDQFDLITRPEGFVVIRGSAGSGKTTVALHRIAWLAHNDRRINSGRTLFLVFSKALRDYVSHVLPALGVPDVNIRTFSEWASFQRRQHFSQLPSGHRHDTPAIVVALKNHPAVLKALQWQVERTPGPRTAAQAIEDWVNATTNPELLAEAVAATVPGAFTTEELERATAWCAAVHAELQLWLEERRGPQGDQGDLFNAGSGRNWGQAGNWQADQRQERERQGRNRGKGKNKGPKRAILDEEDDSLLLHAWQLRVGPLRGRKNKPLRLLHVAIDEVQDFSPVDVRVVLGCLDQRQSITLAGDTQQHVMKDAGFTSWSDFFRHLGVDGAAVETLKISYRCTQQVVNFAMDVLGPLREDDPPLVVRSGPDVELFPFTDHGAAVVFLADALSELADTEPDASVAVLTPSPQLSALYYRGLERSDVPRVSHVNDQKFSFAPGVEVTEVSEVKGLEFDYVVLVEVSAAQYPDTDAARRLLHVGATRAIHQLWLTTANAPSPLLATTR
ncbi:MAG: ATP-binding domain-containing protein [Myxococcales bacterium]|nr:ATP-binding domain-containing protein [Myxococcales bacterium]